MANQCDRFVTEWFIKVARFLVSEYAGIKVFFQPQLFKDELKLLQEDPNYAGVLRQLHTWKLSHGDDGADHMNFDLVVTLGGDGTLLHVTHTFQNRVPPVLCFSLGSLGFLTQFDVEDYRQTLPDVLRGGLLVTLRLRLHCSVTKADDIDDEVEALPRNSSDASFVTPDASPDYEVLNEVVIDRGPSPYLTYLNVYVAGSLVTCVQGDGLIIATPTGSTAYSVGVLQEAGVKGKKREGKGGGVEGELRGCVLLCFCACVCAFVLVHLCLPVGAIAVTSSIVFDCDSAACGWRKHGPPIGAMCSPHPRVPPLPLFPSHCGACEPSH